MTSRSSLALEVTFTCDGVDYVATVAYTPGSHGEGSECDLTSLTYDPPGEPIPAPRWPNTLRSYLESPEFFERCDAVFVQLGEPRDAN